MNNIKFVLKISLFLILFVLFWGNFIKNCLADDTLFGPKQYFRTVGKPNVYMETFQGENRQGKIKILNGDTNGSYRISSALIKINNNQILISRDFNEKVGFLEKVIDFKSTNSLSVELRSGNPGSYLTIEMILPFHEEIPAWRMPELSVTKLTVSPERADPGGWVTLTATISNIGRGISPPAVLVFSVDGVEISTVPVTPLKPDAAFEALATWQAQGTGNHIIRAELKLTDGAPDFTSSNNLLIALARVSGEDLVQPEIEFGKIDFIDLQPIPGESRQIPLKIRNPGFADIHNIPLWFYINGQQIGEKQLIEYLAPGEEMAFSIPWESITPGEHLITVQALLPYYVGDQIFYYFFVKGFSAIVSDITILFSGEEKDKWVSIGPRIIYSTEGRWAGRMYSIAFNPKEPKIIYASGSGRQGDIYNGPGVWKTEDFGYSWKPLGDKLSSMVLGTVVVDPKYPDEIYTGGPDGIFKVRENFWWHFAAPPKINNVRKIAAQRSNSGELVIYASADLGLLRYKSDSSKDWSMGGDWEVIKTGNIQDFEVNPLNPSELYVSVSGGGIFYTKSALYATGDNDWKNLSTGLPPITNDMHIRLFIERSFYTIYAGISSPSPGIAFSIYRSAYGGENFISWSEIRSYQVNELESACTIYNPYIRVLLTDVSESGYKEIIYFSGDCLYQLVNNRKADGSLLSGATYMVSGYGGVGLQAGVDLKALEFDPTGPDKSYYSLGDQGIFFCTINPIPAEPKLEGKNYGKSGDSCTDRNDGLAVVQFFDIDVSKTNSNLIIGGTQDTGTILYTGDLGWLEIYGGDGLYSLINPNDDAIMYSQEQSLDSTKRSSDGGKGWPDNVIGTPIGLGFDDAYITMDPSVSDGLIALGPGRNGLIYSTDKGKNWTPYNLWPNPVSRVIVHPTNSLVIVGTDNGRIFLFAKNTLSSTLVFSHPFNERIMSLSVAPTDPNRLLVTTGGNPQNESRIWTVDIDFANPANSHAENITDNFPDNLTPRVIAGDPNNNYTFYVGTEKGVWRYYALGAGMFPWQPYNEGLPLTTVVDLIMDSNNNLIAATMGRGAWRVKPSGQDIE